MTSDEGVLAKTNSGRGPSEASRAKAQAAKSTKQKQRIEHLRGVLSQIEIRLMAKAVRAQDVSHEFIHREAGIPHATYWRYLNSDPTLRNTAASLVDSSQIREQVQGPDQHLSPIHPHTRIPSDPWKMLEAETNEKLRLAQVNMTLQRQLAAAKTLISLMDLDLVAKAKDVNSKEFLLAAAHSNTLKLTAKLKELAELCVESGLSVDLELTTLVRSLSHPTGDGRGVAAMLQAPNPSDQSNDDY